MYDRQMWRCKVCSHERVYGNTPTPDYGKAPVPVEHARTAFLLCEGHCNKKAKDGKKKHTPHTFTRTLFPKYDISVN